MADLMQRERKILADAWVQAGWPPEAAAVLASGNDTQLTVQLSAIAAALRAAPDWAIDPTPEMLDAGRAAVMAEHCASPKWTPRQHYEASGRSMAGIPEDVLDERGPLTKESVAVMVFGTMVAHRPQEASDA